MLVQCLISVVFLGSNGKLDVKQDYLTGIVNKENKYSYFANFSKEAGERKYIGDYFDTMASKSDCVLVENKK